MKLQNKWLLLLAIPCTLALLALAPQTEGGAKQDPEEADARVRFHQLLYTDMAGKEVVVPARDIHEIRLHPGSQTGSLLEIYYTNDDYSMVHVAAFHLLRKGGTATHEIPLIRTTGAATRYLFPKIP